MNDDSNITFPEFQELCQEAGITVDNVEVMEQDFRAGRALADVTDSVITDYEEHAKPYTAGEATEMIETWAAMLAEGEDLEGCKKMAVKIATQAIRYIAECCHDEGKN